MRNGNGRPVAVLFDIDGTLLTAGGAPRRAFRRALIEHFGTDGDEALDPTDEPTGVRPLDDLTQAVYDTLLREEAGIAGADDTYIWLDVYRPEVPEGVASVVYRCLQKEPASRFQNVADLAQALVDDGALLLVGDERVQPRGEVGEGALQDVVDAVGLGELAEQLERAEAQAVAIARQRPAFTRARRFRHRQRGRRQDADADLREPADLEHPGHAAKRAELRAIDPHRHHGRAQVDGFGLLGVPRRLRRRRRGWRRGSRRWFRALPTHGLRRGRCLRGLRGGGRGRLGLKARDELAEVEFVETLNTEEALRAVSSGRADAYLGDMLAASYLIRRHNLTNLELRGESGLSSSEIRFGVRRDLPQLVELLDRALASLSREEREAIRDRWLPPLTEFNWRKALQVGWPYLLGTLALVAFVLIWNRRIHALQETLRATAPLETTY